MKNKKLLTNLLFAVVILAIAAVLLVVRRVHASGSGLRAELIYGALAGFPTKIRPPPAFRPVQC